MWHVSYGSSLGVVKALLKLKYLYFRFSGRDHEILTDNYTKQTTKMS
jgi:hypothetical protein